MTDLPSDHEERVQRALVSLQGLSVGDSFGERFFGPPGFAQNMIQRRSPPPPKWGWTDDTAMALSVVDVLREHGRIDQERLAELFAERHADEPDRGYGAGARQILNAISANVPWRVAAAGPFGEAGSHGNGAAMRAGPIGAYFADDPTRVVVEAIASALVTHLHPEGQAGAVGVALGAAYATLTQLNPSQVSGVSLLAFVNEFMPQSDTRGGIRQAIAMPPGTSVEHAASVLGSGYQISSVDTVPFCLWAASTHLASYEEALWSTVSALGDRDTTCAIVGGIVALSAGLGSIPERWLLSREGLSLRFKPRQG